MELWSKNAHADTLGQGHRVFGPTTLKFVCFKSYRLLLRGVFKSLKVISLTIWYLGHQKRQFSDF